MNDVWETIKSFHDLSWGEKILSKIDIVRDTPSIEVGAKRILNEAFYETLLTIDNDNFSFTYSIDDSPGPVSKDSVTNYVGRVNLYPVTESGKTFVEWILPTSLTMILKLVIFVILYTPAY